MLEQHIDYSRDSLLTQFGKETLKDRYLKPNEKSPQDAFIMLFGGSLDNFFETAGTNYQIGALTGEWEYPPVGFMKDSHAAQALMD